MRWHSRGPLKASRSVALIVDHPQRDLAGLVLTAFELCQYGVTCHLVPLNLQYNELFALAPEFVVLNYVRRGTEGLARDLAAAGISFGLLDTEGIVWAEYKDYTELLWEDSRLRAGVRCLCMWGENLAKHLAQDGLFPAERLHVTGCPRFDLYAPQWRSVIAEAVESEGSPSPRVLLNTQYSMTNPRFSTVDEHVRHFRLVLGWSDAEIEHRMTIEREAVVQTVTLVRNLALDFPGARLIVRPHPHESPRPYEEALGHLRNVKFSLSGSVQPEIFRAAIVIQRNCTTAVEAGLAGVPALSPEWIPSWFRMELADRVSIPAQSYAEMHSYVSGALAGNDLRTPERTAELRAVVREWFCANDGEAHKRVAAVLRDQINEVPGPNLERCLRRVHGVADTWSWTPAHLGQRMRHALRLPVDFSFRSMRSISHCHWENTDKRFWASEVRSLVERIRLARAAQGSSILPVTVRQSRDCGAYHLGFAGHAVTMALGD